MNPIGVGCIVLVCVFGGAILGMAIHKLLPEHHLNADSKDVIKLGMGLIATMSALVLALLTNSAKGSYDTQRKRSDASRRQRPPARPRAGALRPGD